MSENEQERARRRAAVAAGETDVARWSRADSFAPNWSYRAGLAAQMIPACSRVLDLGCGAMDLERALPPGCVYLPADLVRRDERTLVCDFNAGEFPDGVEADAVTLLGVLEYIQAPLDLLRKVRGLGRPLVCSYSITDRRPQLDRAAQGWINAYDFAGLEALMRQAGFRLAARQEVDPLQDLFKWVPDDQVPPPVRLRKVAVVSHFNAPNFGDRLGYHVLNGLLPAGAEVSHLSLKPWVDPPDEAFDLVILGIGGSLNATAVARPELNRLLERATHSLGLFGTQYRHQYREWIDPTLFDALLSRLTVWWARYEEDIAAFGRGRGNVRHLGDLLVSAFPMARPTLDRTITIPAEFQNQEMALDRAIQQIQRYRRVKSARLHPLLCALTSAEEVAYLEQREGWGDAVSGKFRSLLMDVFGRTYDEGAFFAVDRPAVARYKARVDANLGDLRAQIAGLLA